jgi:hypothetical protein
MVTCAPQPDRQSRSTAFINDCEMVSNKSSGSYSVAKRKFEYIKKVLVSLSMTDQLAKKVPIKRSESHPEERSYQIGLPEGLAHSVKLVGGSS